MSTLAEPKTKPLLTMRELYDEYGGAFGINSLYTAAAAGKLKTVKVGRKILVPRSEIDAFIQREAA